MDDLCRDSLGIVTISGKKRLILDTIAVGGDSTQGLTSTRTVDTSQKLAYFNLDDVISIGAYSSDFIVNGSLNGQNVRRYYNTTSNNLVTLSSAPIEIKRKIPTNH